MNSSSVFISFTKRNGNELTQVVMIALNPSADLRNMSYDCHYTYSLQIFVKLFSFLLLARVCIPIYSSQLRIAFDKVFYYTGCLCGFINCIRISFWFPSVFCDCLIAVECFMMTCQRFFFLATIGKTLHDISFLCVIFATSKIPQITLVYIIVETVVSKFFGPFIIPIWIVSLR